MLSCVPRTFYHHVLSHPSMYVTYRMHVLCSITRTQSLFLCSTSRVPHCCMCNAACAEWPDHRNAQSLHDVSLSMRQLSAYCPASSRHSIRCRGHCTHIASHTFVLLNTHESTRYCSRHTSCSQRAVPHFLFPCAVRDRVAFQV